MSCAVSVCRGEFGGYLPLFPIHPTKTPLIVLSALPYEDAKQHAGFLHKELGFRLVEPS